MKYRKGIPVFPSFNRINPDRLFPTIYPDFIDRLVEQFQSYQSKQINPDASWIRLNSTDSYSCFNRINPNRSIPTRLRLARHEKHYTVSIVSIQTDQSRPDAYGAMGATINLSQSYQSRQINPDANSNRSIPWPKGVSIVSIQTNQSRQRNGFSGSFHTTSFNRINPNKSIPTLTPHDVVIQRVEFQSYQSKQINPD